MAVEVVNPMTQIAEEGGPEAAGFVFSLMAQSTREREAIEASILVSIERERDEWRDRAIAAEGRLYRAQERLMEIFD